MCADTERQSCGSLGDQKRDREREKEICEVWNGTEATRMKPFTQAFLD